MGKTMHLIALLKIPRSRRACVRAAKGLAGLAACLAAAGVAGAQSAKDSALYVQAQQMVANGDAAGGRKLADSVAAAAHPGSSAYAEGLYWRATLAANARDSEHEYRQIIVDYPLSARVPDALLRIGQLESARGESAAALQHFQRLVLEHPQSPLRADASYWVARMYFDANDAAHACSANADALANVRPSNVELKNRIDFQQQRCRGVTLATNAPPAATGASVSAPVTVPVKPAPVAAESAPPRSVASTVEPSKPQPPKKSPPKVAPPTAPSEVSAEAPSPPTPPVAPPPREPPSSSAGARVGVVSRAPTKEEVDRALASAEQSDIARKAIGTPATPSRAARSAATPAAAPAATPAAPVTSENAESQHGSYAVQVAAFSARAPAAALDAKLRARGYNTYVDGTSAPFRVRIGHYPTHAAAAAALAKLKAKRIDGFVVER
jgi:tetratricopeptide (TPR) repeat protein